MASYSTTDTGRTSTTHPTQSAPGGSGGLQDGVQGVKGVLAGIHGIGEKLRGEFNEGIDEAFNENGSQAEGVARNAAVANAGDKELTTGQFAHGTKNREGVVPGNNERRI